MMAAGVVLDWQLALVALTVAPVLLFVSGHYKRRLRQQSREVKKLESGALGVVHEVLGSDSEDIFHGVVVHTGHVGHEVMVPAGEVTRITNRRLETRLSSQEIRELPPYREEESYQLGFVGLFRKHLGWIREKDGNPPD